MRPSTATDSGPLPLRARALTLLAAGAAAQHVNVDFGDDEGTPGDIPGAACAAGYWNTVTSFPSGNLQWYQGGMNSGIWLELVSGTPTFGSDVPPQGPPASTAPLYNDFLSINGAKQIRIHGLDSASTYQVFAYAWHPSQMDTEVKIHNQANYLGIGGPYPTGFLHQRHISYWATQNFISGTSTVDVFVRPYQGMPANEGALNGLQIRLIEPVGAVDTGCDPGEWEPGKKAELLAYGTDDGMGSLSMSKQDLLLRATDVPAGEYVQYFLSATPSGQSTLSTGGELCMSGPLYRMPIAWADAGGIARACVDYTTAPMDVILAGQTFAFQAWFRHPAGGTWTSTSIDIDFAP